MAERNQMITANAYLKTRDITKSIIYRLVIHTLLNKDQDTLIEQSFTLILQSGSSIFKILVVFLICSLHKLSYYCNFKSSDAESLVDCTFGCLYK